MKKTIFSVMFVMLMGIATGCSDKKTEGTTEAADTTAVDSVKDSTVVDTLSTDTLVVDSVK